MQEGFQQRMLCHQRQSWRLGLGLFACVSL
jgi:hypothetical protein